MFILVSRFSRRFVSRFVFRIPEETALNRENVTLILREVNKRALNNVFAVVDTSASGVLYQGPVEVTISYLNLGVRQHAALLVKSRMKTIFQLVRVKLFSLVDVG
jgi:hypothetical protein